MARTIIFGARLATATLAFAWVASGTLIVLRTFVVAWALSRVPIPDSELPKLPWER